MFSKAQTNWAAQANLAWQVLKSHNMMCLFKYPRVYYSPLCNADARQCLKELLMVALKEFQSLTRLSNVCFSRSFEVILIDADSCDSIYASSYI